MAYGQKNYSEHLGNGPYPISATGCLLVAFCNLLQRLGEDVDPVALNNWFNAHNAFLASPEDGAGTKDDLAYGSISAYDPTIHVTGSGGAGWPGSNNAIVEFRYKSVHTGALITHFCLVADAANHVIVDSYDGLVKTPAQYESVYGQPISWATLDKAVPAVITPISSPAPAPAQSPAPVDGVTALTQKVTITTPVLVVRTAPNTSSPGGQANSTDGNLHQGTVVDITGYVHSQNVDGNDVWLRSVHGHWFWSGGTDFNLGQTAAPTPPAPAPAPAAAPAPAKPANTTYTKLDQVLELQTNKEPTTCWALDFVNDAHATAVDQFPAGTPFPAYGKAQRTDGDKPCYYMTEQDFGQADTTGVPAHNNGVNTVDLSPIPAAPAAPAAQPAPAVSPPQPAPAAPETPAAPTPPAADAGEKVPVTVGSWQKSYTGFLSPQEYIANQTVIVENIDAENPIVPPTQELLKGQTVKVAGTFSRDGVKYYRTANSLVKSQWYGIPVTALTKLDGKSEDELDKIMNEIAQEEQALSGREKAVATAAASTGFVQWVLHFFRHNKKG